MPAERVMSSPAQGVVSGPCHATSLEPSGQVPVNGVPLVRCTVHGIAYDSEREVCPECAKGPPA